VNRHLILIQIICRAIFAAGIVALLWAGGQMGYAKTISVVVQSDRSGND